MPTSKPVSKSKTQNSKSKVADLKKRLEYEPQNAWEIKGLSKTALEVFCKEYIAFLSGSKTEREFVTNARQLAEKKGFKATTKSTFLMINKDKNIALVRLGKKPLKDGIKMVMAHIDSPRLDIKQNPLYEDSTGVALMKTHYYGGIKKFQWLTRPLAIHGVVILKNKKKLELVIGEKETDPIFIISDIMPHLSKKVQDDKKMREGIEGEKMNLMVGSIPYDTKEEIKGKIKLNILKYLEDQYGIAEEDFLSAELEVVPAGPYREGGFDRSFIIGYGQDDRACSYTAMRALLDAKPTADTQVCFLVDKEEIGSDGNTGAKSMFIKQLVVEIFRRKGETVDMVLVEECLANTKAISADVHGAIDPDYKEVHEERNSAKMGYGMAICKFTGHGGKYGASDANAEYTAKFRDLFNANNIPWQMAELGKVDEGGGGTIAKHMAEFGMEIIDMGPALLSVHAPLEIASKVDIYLAYQAFKVFYEKF